MDSRLSTLVARYYLYMATSTLGFLIPVWVLLLDEARAFSYTQITLLDVVFFSTILLAELPTGYVGDRLGRRNALVCSSVGVGLSAAAFGVAQSFTAFLVVYVAWGVAQTFRTGNDSAWLYDTLSRYAEEATFTRVRGRGMAVLLAANTVTAVAGGYLYTMNPAYPFYATGVVNVLSGVVLLTMPEELGETEEAFTLSKARRAIGGLAAPSLRWFVVYVSLFFAVGWSADLFIQPISRAAGLDVVGLGYLYALLSAVAALASNYAGALADRVGISTLLHAAPLLLGAGLVLVGLLPVAAAPVFLFARGLLSMAGPISETYVNERTPALGRATVLSATSMLLSLSSIPVKLVSGPIADATSLFVTVAVLGGALLVVSAVLLVARRPVHGPVSAEAVDG
ncbi:MFS transporter [Natronomonas sp. EA1]|uniref:MFS transporter n=1 Tax=Natronomonas sp. EA1 TaxID=3421655 RepID=UPI003EC112A2